MKTIEKIFSTGAMKSVIFTVSILFVGGVMRPVLAEPIVDITASTCTEKPVTNLPFASCNLQGGNDFFRFQTYLSCLNLIDKKTSCTDAGCTQSAPRQELISIAAGLRGIPLETGYQCQNEYTDTVKGVPSWVCEVAEKSQAAGLITGTSKLFRPLDTMTRAEAFKVIFGSICQSPPVISDNWTTDVAKLAIKLGFTTRTVATFEPDRPLLRQELYVIAARAAVWIAKGQGSTTSYTPPIGIPAPSFGIDETYRMYDNDNPDTTKRNPALTYTPSEEGGYYTHYVEYKNPHCTQDWVANNGTASNPRCTVPRELPAGSIVEIHGTYDAPNRQVDIMSQGTKDLPVFVRGVGENPRIVVTMFVKGTYVILENLTFEDEDGDLSGGRGGNIFILAPSSYVALRHSELIGNLSRDWGSGISVASWETGAIADQIVLYDNISRNHGQLNPLPGDPDKDFSGIVIAGGSSNVWVLDNEMYGNSGDGIMINANDGSDGNSIHHVYVGRNVMHDNLQSGFWVKSAKDIIFSQNVSYNHRPAMNNAGTPGACGGSQYGAERVWFMYNDLYNCDYGIYISSGNSAQRPEENMYYIGNIIHNIHNSHSKFAASGYQNSAIMIAGGVNHYIMNNTMYDVDSGMSSAASTPFYISNNIISNIAQSTGSHILLELAIDPDRPLDNWHIDNNLFYQNGDDDRIRLESTGMSLSEIQTARPSVCVHCLTENPLFTSTSNNNFHLNSTSPAINQGTESDVYQTFQDLYGLNIRVDFDGNPRPQGGVWDIGAYEYGSSGR